MGFAFKKICNELQNWFVVCVKLILFEPIKIKEFLRGYRYLQKGIFKNVEQNI